MVVHGFIREDDGLQWYYDNIKSIERDNNINKLLDISLRETHYRLVDQRSIEPLSIRIKDIYVKH